MSTLSTVVTSMRSLVDAMDSFMTANGFTQESAPTGTTSGSAAWSAGEIFVEVSWTTQSILEIRQGIGYSGGLTQSAGYNTELDLFGVSLTNGQLYGFANNAGTATERYAHFVLEFNRDGRYAHFGFEHVEKYGTWDGGALVYGWEWSGGAAAQDPGDANHRVLADGNHTGTANTVNLATMRLRNFLQQPANSEYACITSGTATPTADTGGDPVWKVEGYSRHGPWPQALLHVRGNPNNAWIPLIPVQLAVHGTAATRRRLIGRMRDVRVCNIGDVQPADVLNVGGVDWQFFPWGQKLTNPGSGVIGSRNFGVAYRVV